MVYAYENINFLGLFRQLFSDLIPTNESKLYVNLKVGLLLIIRIYVTSYRLTYVALCHRYINHKKIMNYGFTA